MKRFLSVIFAAVIAASCVSCETTDSETPLPIATSTTADVPELGDGYSLVTDYDEQGRVLRETICFSGERYPDGTLYEFDASGDLVPADGAQAEQVENEVVNYALYDYDGENYAVQIRRYQAEYPSTPHTVTQKDALDRVILWEKHNLHWGITEDFCRSTFAYEEGTSNLELSILTSFVQDTRPQTKPVTHTAQYALTLGSDAHTISSDAMGVSYGIDGILNFSFREIDKDGNDLRARFYDQNGALTNTVEFDKDAPATE